MNMPRNIFEEQWVKKMNELFEKAKNSRQAYEKFIDTLEWHYRKNPEDDNNYVRARVAELREKIFWSKDQSTKNILDLPVITSQTFQQLKEDYNYKKFVGYYNKLAENSAINKA